MRARELFEGIHYERWKKKDGQCREGCFEIGGRHVHAFPHIKRVLNLEGGVRRVFGRGEFQVEEKLDGYNIRAVNFEGRVFCFTRTGHVEPFATEFLRGSPIEELSEDYVVCGEMLGATPFTTSEGWEASFHVFDLMKNGKFLSAKDRADVLSSYAVEEVPKIGTFSIETIEELKKALRSMDEDGKEGIVMKGKKRIKYVLPKHEARQFEEAWKFAFDLPGGFFYERVLRATTAANDLGRGVSANPLQEFHKAMEEFQKKGYVSQEYKVKVKNLTTWADIKRRLNKSKTVRIKEISIKEGKEHFYIRFEKIFNKTSAAFSRWKSGRAFVD